tara:strand:+ start:2644 stop:3027 length:384 start_codon:yes stop_codon:yes gene_type:complete
MSVTHSTALRDTLCNAAVDALDAGSADASGDMRIDTSGNVEVALLVFSNPAFGASSSGTATASAITSDTNADGGTAAKAILRNRDNTTCISCSVTASGGGGDLIISNTTVGVGDTVSCSSLTYSAPP